MKKPILERFMRFVDKRINGCWVWTAYIERNGYGRFMPVKGKNCWAHRISYELHVGPIPQGLHLDHLCKNRACCNPAHLQPVTQRENNLRSNGLTALNAVKTHCKRGHEFTDENTFRRKNGKRNCVACRRLADNTDARREQQRRRRRQHEVEAA